MRTTKIILFFLAITIAFAGALVLEYGLHTYMTNSKLLYTLAGGAILVIGLSFAVPEIKTHRTGYLLAMIFGIVMMPYFAFIIGKMDLYVVDDNLARGLTVKEVRVTMEDMKFKTKEGPAVIVLKGGNTLVMHPGENEVRVGTMDIPKGTYVGGEIAPMSIEVDMQLNLNEVLAALKEGTGLPPGIPKELWPSDTEIKEQIASLFTSNTPPIGKLKNVNRNGDTITFTLDIDSSQIPFPKEIPLPQFEYPGIGGPDITLRIFLGTDGKPESIQPTVHLPPGLPAEQISAFASSIPISGPVKPVIFTTS